MTERVCGVWTRARDGVTEETAVDSDRAFEDAVSGMCCWSDDGAIKGYVCMGAEKRRIIANREWTTSPKLSWEPSVELTEIGSCETAPPHG